MKNKNRKKNQKKIKKEKKIKKTKNHMFLLENSIQNAIERR